MDSTKAIPVCISLMFYGQSEQFSSFHSWLLIVLPPMTKSMCDVTSSRINLYTNWQLVEKIDKAWSTGVPSCAEGIIYLCFHKQPVWHTSYCCFLLSQMTWWFLPLGYCFFWFACLVTGRSSHIPLFRVIVEDTNKAFSLWGIIALWRFWELWTPSVQSFVFL